MHTYLTTSYSKAGEKIYEFIVKDNTGQLLSLMFDIARDWKSKNPIDLAEIIHERNHVGLKIIYPAEKDFGKEFLEFSISKFKDYKNELFKSPPESN